MNVRNELLDDMVCVVKCETPPEWRWKLCVLQHGKRKSESGINNIGWRGLYRLDDNNNTVFGWPQLGIRSPLWFPAWSKYILGSGVELN